MSPQIDGHPPTRPGLQADSSIIKTTGSKLESSVRKPVARRVEWIDTLRGFAVCLVAVYHVWIQLPAAARPVGVGWLDSVLGNYRMPALMFTSGILLDLSLRKPLGVYIVGKLRAIVWPWLLWTAIMVPLLGLKTYHDPEWWLNGTHTWYLMALTTAFAIALLTRPVPHWVVAIALLMIALLLKEYGESSVASIAQRWLWNDWFFFAGAALADRWQDVARAPRWMFTLALTLTILWSGWRLSLGAPGPRSLLTAAMALVGILLVIWVLTRLPDDAFIRGVNWIGRNSIVTYLAHWPAAIIIYRLLGEPGGWFGFLVVTLAALGVCVLMTWVRPFTKSLYHFPLPRRNKAVAVS